MDIRTILARIDMIQEAAIDLAKNNENVPATLARHNVGDGRGSILKDFERELKANPRAKSKSDLMREYREFVNEYGGVGGYGAASQAPQGTAQKPDPAAAQQKIDAQQIQKSTNAMAPQLNSQGSAQPLNKIKFNDVMQKLDAKSNTELAASDLKQLGPLAVAASKALQNPQTANQLKQVITKADQADQQKQQQVKQAQQQAGTNAPANQQKPGQPGVMVMPQSAGKTT